MYSARRVCAAVTSAIRPARTTTKPPESRRRDAPSWRRARDLTPAPAVALAGRDHDRRSDMISDLTTTARRASFRVDAIPAAELDRIRANGVDDFGNPLEPRVVRQSGGAALRGCRGGRGAG